MSKPSSDQLFRLIKSLTTAEKRYFKIFASRHTIGEKNEYVNLFDAIDKQENYNETKLLKLFSNNTFTHSPAIAKNRLYEAVLKSLHAYHGDSSVDVELQRLMHSTEILFKKSLYDECRKILNRAKKIASKYEKHFILLEIYRWEKRLLEKDSYAGSNIDDVAEMNEQDVELLGKIKNYSDFWYIKSRLFLLLNKKGKVRDSSELNNFKTIIDNTLLKNEDEALSYETRYLYYHIYSAYYFGIGDYQNSYTYIDKHLRLIEKNADVFGEEPNKYFAVLSNMIYLCTQLRKFDEIPSYLQKLKEIPNSNIKKMNEDLGIKLFSSTYSAELSLYIQTGDFDKALGLVSEIENGLAKYNNKISKVRIAFFYFNLAVVFFALGDFSGALKWINKLLNDSDIDSSQDIHCIGRIFNLIIHIEIGNNDLIPYTFRSTQRYLSKRERIYRFESVFLNFINKLSKADSPDDVKNCFRLLRPELMALSKDPYEKSVFEYFDFITWVEGKYLQLPFSEMVRKKLNSESNKSLLK
jgi:tetratricopeptide (TPR) repeat protein